MEPALEESLKAVTDDAPNTTNCDIEEALSPIVKGASGQLMSARAMGAPEVFLNERFPDWQQDNKTYTVPPCFTPDGHHQIGLKGKITHSDRGIQGEFIVSNLLRELGEKQGFGMFIIRGFQLIDISKWNKRVKDDYVVPTKLVTQGTQDRENDFIVFHHTLGVVSIEVKNDQRATEQCIRKATDQLQTSCELVRALSTVRGHEMDFNHHEVIALPSIKKIDFNPADFQILQDKKIIFLFQEDCLNVDTFGVWWKKVFVASAEANRPLYQSEPYQLALSYMLMIRHLGPVTELDCITSLQERISSYTEPNKSGRGTSDEAQGQLQRSMFPQLLDWYDRVLAEGIQLSDGDPNVLGTFMKQHKITNKDIRASKGCKLINRLVQKNKFINGDKVSQIDVCLCNLLKSKYLISYKNIIEYYSRMRQVWMEIDETSELSERAQQSHTFLKLESTWDLNTLDHHLSKSHFINGDKPTRTDKQVFNTLTGQIRLRHALLPIVMTLEQLAVFEGPQKQLIIGPPGSGKTELMKFKALELDRQIKASKSKAKILYIVANGSPAYDNNESLFLTHMQQFFHKAKSSCIEIVTAILEEESETDLKKTVATLREKIASCEYAHVFIDEYWIGSKPEEHEIILELLNGVPGYVWISSVFDFMLCNEKVIKRTKPLLVALEQCSGTISYVKQVLRATNHIIDLERLYSQQYAHRSYPYGTREILGHSLEGLPISWECAKSIDEMYTISVDLVCRAITQPFSILKDKIPKTQYVGLNPEDILVVNFAVRVQASLDIMTIEKRLQIAHVPFWVFGQKRLCGAVTLLDSLTRDSSSFLDGVEWRMVIVILPSDLLLNTAKLSNGAQSLRNYDTYIAFFRTMVKLVVISDKWTNSQTFMSDVAAKSK